MEEIIRTNDIGTVAFASALLRAEDIDCFVFDVHTSVLEGSLGVLPQRLMVSSRDGSRARQILRDNGLAAEMRDA